MTITSVSFLVFLSIVIAVFYICPVKFRWLILLGGSIYFYIAAGAVKFLPFILFTTFTIWICAYQIGKLYEQQDIELAGEGVDRKMKKAIREKYKNKAKKFLLIALVLCIGILCVTKFTKYVVKYMNMFAGDGRFSAAWIIVPLGISYYTFSTVGYILDVYWKRYVYEKNFFRFFLYAIYFPHIVQGPISRYSLLGQELKKELRFDSQRVVYGMELMVWGFFKKLVIADRLNIFVQSIYDGQSHAGSLMIIAMIFDAFQIYTDFSGYTDIVRGASQIFGVTLEQNFNHPFFSKNVPEFWRRWHMTLGGWFKDYVYYPTTISSRMKSINKWTKKNVPERVSRFITIVIPVFITWVLTGLWHGTGKTYVCWGLYYSTLITISVAFRPEFEALHKLLHINTEAFSFKLYQMVKTFCCFMGGRLLTSPGSLHNTKLVIKCILKDPAPWGFVNGAIYEHGINRPEMLIIFAALLTLLVVDNLQERFHEKGTTVREMLDQQNLLFRWMIMIAGVFAVIIFGVYGMGVDATAFLYTQY